VPRRYITPLSDDVQSRPTLRKLQLRPGRRDQVFPAIGNKAAGLATLMRLGLPVPRTYVCTWDAFERARSGDPGVAGALHSELCAIVRPDQRYAVRSSADIEDDPRHSFAGQFKTVLDVTGVDGVWQAIQEVWQSAGGTAAATYLARQDARVGGPRMAVVIQEMAAPQVSGVAFSRNPITGLDEVVVEAVAGSGEALVQKGVTPERWVNKWGDWIAQAEQSLFPQAVMDEIAAQTRRIARALGQAVDLEWVYDGATVYWVQVRAITSQLSIDIYSDKIAREVLPGQIKPLVWSVNVPLVNGAWVRLFSELIGPNDIDPTRLARAFHYRAYFNMGVIGQIFEMLGMPRDSLELLMGIDAGGDQRPTFKPTARTYRHTPRMLRFAADKWRFARQVEVYLPLAQQRYRALRRDSLDQLSEQELLAEIDRLYQLTEQTAYFNIVTPLLMGLYNRLLAAQLARSGIDAAQIDMAQDRDVLHKIDPTLDLEQLRQKYRLLSAAEVEALVLAETSAPDNHRSGQPMAPPLAGGIAGEPSPAAQAFRRALADFVERFGHFSDSGNDFSSVPWRENPELLLRMIASEERAAVGSSLAGPHPGVDGSPTVRKLAFDSLDLPAQRRPLLNLLYRRARSFRLYRDQVSSLYTLGYGLFRDYFLALGAHLARRGVIAARDDIFYLYRDEVREIVAGGQRDCATLVTVRRQEMDACRDVALPAIIYGNRPPPVAPASALSLAGTPTSRGYYQGPARVIRSLSEFDKLQPGDVLVIPFSDVGWTPLFAKAGAVIAESGGILSHSSIIAREYAIPAVVSVPGACRLRDGTIVTVDGYSGSIVVSQ